MILWISWFKNYFRAEISEFRDFSEFSWLSNRAITTISFHERRQTNFLSRDYPYSYPIQDLFDLRVKFSSLSPIRALVKSAPYDMSVPPYQTNMYKKCQNIFMVSEYGTEYGSSVRLFDPGLIMVLGIGLIQKWKYIFGINYPTWVKYKCQDFVHK